MNPLSGQEQPGSLLELQGWACMGLPPSAGHQLSQTDELRGSCRQSPHLAGVNHISMASRTFSWIHRPTPIPSSPGLPLRCSYCHTFKKYPIKCRSRGRCDLGQRGDPCPHEHGTRPHRQEEGSCARSVNVFGCWACT